MTSQQKQAILRDYEAGFRRAAIATARSVPVSEVNRVIHELHRPPKRDRQSLLQQAANSMLAEGYDPAVVSACFGPAAD